MATEEAWLDSFIFQQRHGRLNVRALSRLDLTDVIDHVQVEKLHDILENLAFCNLKKTDLPSLSDEMVIKAFRVSQLIIEYLLNRQNHLDMKVEDLVKEMKVLAMDIETLVQDNNTLAEANDVLKRELKSRKKQLATLEVVLTSKGGIQGVSSAHVCKTCGKAFSERHYLVKHCARRNHSGFDLREGSKENVSMVGNNDNDRLVTSFKQVVKEELREELESSYAKALEIHAENLEQVRNGFEASVQRQLEDQRSRYEATITRLQAKVDTVEAIRKQDAHDAREKLVKIEEENRRLLKQVKDMEFKPRPDSVNPVVEVVDVATEVIAPSERAVPAVDASVQVRVEEEGAVAEVDVESIGKGDEVEVDVEEISKAPEPKEKPRVEPVRTSTATTAIAMQTVNQYEEKCPREVEVSEVVREYLAALDHNEITASVLRKMKELEVEVCKEISKGDVAKKIQAKVFCPVESGLVKSRWNHNVAAVKERESQVAKKLQHLTSSIGITKNVIARLLESGELNKLEANLQVTLDNVIGRDKSKATRRGKVAEINLLLVQAERSINMREKEQMPQQTGTSLEKPKEAPSRATVLASTKDEIEGDTDSVESSLSSSFDGQQEVHIPQAQDTGIAPPTRMSVENIDQGSDEEVKDSSMLEQYALGSDGSALSSISHSGFIPQYEEDSSLANSFQRNVTHAEILEDQEENVKQKDDERESVEARLTTGSREQRRGSIGQVLTADTSTRGQSSSSVRDKEDKEVAKQGPESQQKEAVVSLIQAFKGSQGVDVSEQGPPPDPIQVSRLEGGSSVEHKSHEEDESPLPDPPLPNVTTTYEARSASTVSSTRESDESIQATEQNDQHRAAESEGIRVDIQRVNKAAFGEVTWAARINVDNLHTAGETDQSSGNRESESGSFLLESDLSESESDLSQDELVTHE